MHSTLRVQVNFAALLLVGLTTACVPKTRSDAFHCETSADCEEGRACDEGWCVVIGSGECVGNADCVTPGPCQELSGARCQDRNCVYVASASGAACDTGDACTEGVCDADGNCVGGPACWAPPDSVCITASIQRVYTAIGTCSIDGCNYTYSDIPCPNCPACGDSCLLDIDGDFAADQVAPGTFNPQDGCEVCDPSTDPELWTAYTCVASAPINPCLELSGTCNPASGSGACSGASCCEYAPAWDGSGTAPACPLAGQDPEQDGVEGGGETWTGACTTAGACSGCTLPSECDDGNPCSVDACNGGTCENDYAAGVGATCTVSATDDGLCVAAGAIGVCRLADGEACDASSQCASSHCGCANAGCTARVCSTNPCGCEFDADGNGACDGALNDEVQDPPFCDLSDACFGGACLGLPGTFCELAGDCGSGICDCANAGCTGRVCAEAACDCAYDTDGNGVCDGNLNVGEQDPPFCTGANACNAGACEPLQLGDGMPCNGDALCINGNCECADNECIDQVCAPSPCACGWDSTGDGTCDGDLVDGTEDPEDCTDATQCWGGSCITPTLKSRGELCVADGECQTGICECAHEECNFRRCADVRCFCQMTSITGSECTDDIKDDVDDSADSCDTFTCNGTGGCNKANGQACTNDLSCDSNLCNCAADDCTSRRCSPSACVCQFDTQGDGTCDGDLTDQLSDPDDCTGLNWCISGACVPQ